MEKFLKLHETTIVFPFFQDECDRICLFFYYYFFLSTNKCCCPEIMAFNGITVTLGSLLDRHPSALTVNVSSSSQPDCQERFLEQSRLVDAECLQAQDEQISHFCSGNPAE